ncbi:AAA family ATPase [Ramlibacter sp. AN1015]|uniref:bifunctional aminoglycoside phosphotransferase/ATP-binding protein n=1 Tax=Ramlibacter sp. AN1015 TaxID=3133428 RepID=UPI0030BCF60B
MAFQDTAEGACWHGQARRLMQRKAHTAATPTIDDMAHTHAPPADQDPAWVRHLATRLQAQRVETHISWVLLTGNTAYKLKKPLRLPFLDYSTLALRRHWCEEEVRLNERLAPKLYLGVSAVTGPPDAPEIDGQGPVLDYAVRMRRFASGALFSEQLMRNVLSTDAVDELAVKIANLHRRAPAWTGPFEAAGVGSRALAAWDGARRLMPPGDARFLRNWLEASNAALHATRQERFVSGHVREGHGDLHLDNVVSLDGAVAAFDCIEFDPTLRFIDVIDDACFTLMDFAARSRADLGWRFFNLWLDETGEHAGLPLLRHGLVYRALVRAQVLALRGGQAAAHNYAALALTLARPARARLAITHGLPGSGKTFASQHLLQSWGAVRLRTDVERKRMFGLQPSERSAHRGLDIYTHEASTRTYGRVLELAAIALAAGWPTVIDGAFLRREERDRAHALARRMGVPFGIVACTADPTVLRQRLATRRGDASEADATVLDKLQLALEELSPQEQALVLAEPF